MYKNTSSLQFVHETETIRPKSLIITIMGDVVSVHGGEIWSGDIVRIIKSFGIREESARIGLQRLVKDGWLVKNKKNRLVYYRFSQMAHNIYELNQHHIYRQAKDEWEGGWLLVYINNDYSEHGDFIKQMKWLGYRKLGKNFLLFPENDTGAIKRIIEINHLQNSVMFFSGKLVDLNKGGLVRHLAEDLWNISNFLIQYQSYIEHFSPWGKGKLATIKANPELACYLRIYLIHEYRRLVLRFPRLPRSLQSNPAILDQFYELTSSLYHELRAASEDYLIENCTSSKGRFHNSDKSFRERFKENKVTIQQIKQVKEKIIEFSEKKLKMYSK